MDVEPKNISNWTIIVINSYNYIFIPEDLMVDNLFYKHSEHY